MKNTIKKYLLLSVLFLTTISFVYTLNTNEKGVILKDFKKNQYDMLFNSDLTDFSGEFNKIFDISKKIDIYQGHLEQNSDNIDLVNNSSLGVYENIYNLESQISLLDNQIKKYKDKINDINNNIIKVKNLSISSKLDIEKLNIVVNEKKELLNNFSIYLLEERDKSFVGGDFDNFRSILLNNESIDVILDNIYYNSLLENSTNKLLKDYSKQISNLYIKRVSLKKQEINLKKLRKNAIIANNMLINKKDFKDRILNISKGKESFYKKYINNKIKIEKLLKEKTFKEKSKFNFLRDSILKKYNCNFIDINNENNNVKVRELSKKCFDINRMIANEARLKTSVYNKNNIFNWPVNNVRGISAYFKDTEYIKDFGTNHDAIDIVVSQGTDIKPVSAGYVIAIKKPTGDNYSYIAIKHKNGYISVYGHLSKVYVDKFDYVDYNDIIAQSGGEFGTPGAGFLTTGPHLHLEIFKEKSYIDPLTHLDITNLNYNSLPKKYHDKYYIDFKNKNGYEYINKSKKSFVFRIKGTNEIERQKYLLNTYASSDFKNWQIWIDESLEENIDPSFVMCLGLAETSLGRYLKTPYNIGNVGNTDSGATKYFKNPRSGIYWVAKTLNNRYLKRYNSLNMLSRYGNKDLTKPIYASSDTHWHKNIKRCLSHIKGTFIDDNYNFRLK